jgi:microcystin-dependent protein
MEKYLIFLIIIIIVIYCLFCNQIDTKDTFTTVSPSVIGIDDTNSIATLGDLARDYMTTRTQSNSTLIPSNINFKNRHVLVSDNDNWLRLKSKTDLSQNSNLAVKDFNVDGSFNLLPSGMIFAWSGETVPTGWVVCDGSNGTPDLRGRFILGQGQGSNLTIRSLGDISGRADIRLSIDEMPNHSHIYDKPNTTIGRNDFNNVFNNEQPAPSFGGKANTNERRNNENSKWEGDTNIGGNPPLPFNNMPPFYILVYIMKL